MRLKIYSILAESFSMKMGDGEMIIFFSYGCSLVHLLHVHVAILVHYELSEFYHFWHSVVSCILL